MVDHNELIREQFRVQAGTFTDSGFAARGLDWIVDELEPAADDQVLDVAAGAAHLGRALAPRVAHVSALDLTPEMLQQGQQLATSSGIRNIAFLLGDAAALPWIDGQFDLVVCRLTLHQVADPAAVVQEMLRVTRPGGRVAVIDLTAPDDPALAAGMNRIEVLRDPSHARTLSERETHDLLTAGGATVVHCSRHDQPVDVQDWMQRTATPPATRELIQDEFENELAGGQSTGLRPFRDEAGVLQLTHTWTMTLVLVGQVG